MRATTSLVDLEYFTSGSPKINGWEGVEKQQQRNNKNVRFLFGPCGGLMWKKAQVFLQNPKREGGREPQLKLKLQHINKIPPLLTIQLLTEKYEAIKSIFDAVVWWDITRMK